MSLLNSFVYKRSLQSHYFRPRPLLANKNLAKVSIAVRLFKSMFCETLFTMLTTVLLTVATWYELTVQLAALAPNMLCMLLVFNVFDFFIHTVFAEYNVCSSSVQRVWPLVRNPESSYNLPT